MGRPVKGTKPVLGKDFVSFPVILEVRKNYAYVKTVEGDAVFSSIKAEGYPTARQVYKMLNDTDECVTYAAIIKEGNVIDEYAEDKHKCI